MKFDSKVGWSSGEYIYVYAVVYAKSIIINWAENANKTNEKIGQKYTVILHLVVTLPLET
jgi:hypothetical protein